MENNLAKEKARLSAMMAHLHMTRERIEEAKPEPTVSGRAARRREGKMQDIQ